MNQDDDDELLAAGQVAARYNLPNPRWVARRARTLFQEARVEFSPRVIRFRRSKLDRIVERRNGGFSRTNAED
jgi:hypothetical protein